MSFATVSGMAHSHYENEQSSNHLLDDPHMITPDAIHQSLERIEQNLQTLLAKSVAPPASGIVTADEDRIHFRMESIMTLDALENAYIRHVLRDCGGNKLSAAKLLGIDPSTLYRKLARIQEGTRVPQQLIRLSDVQEG